MIIKKIKLILQREFCILRQGLKEYSDVGILTVLLLDYPKMNILVVRAFLLTTILMTILKQGKRTSRD